MDYMWLTKKYCTNSLHWFSLSANNSLVVGTLWNYILRKKNLIK